MKTLALPSQTSRQPLADVVTATGGGSDVVGEMRARARTFAEPLLAGETTSSGENVLAHADATRFDPALLFGVPAFSRISSSSAGVA